MSQDATTTIINLTTQSQAKNIKYSKKKIVFYIIKSERDIDIECDSCCGVIFNAKDTSL